MAVAGVEIAAAIAGKPRSGADFGPPPFCVFTVTDQVNNKRRKEQSRKQKQLDKEQRRAQRAAERQARRELGGGKDTDLAGIVPGPQPGQIT